MRLSAAALIAASLVAVAPAFAIDQEKKWELQLLASGSSDNDFESGGVSFTGQLGYYFTQELELSVRQSISYNDTGSDSAFGAATRIGGFYHFNFSDDQRWVPYAGANIGYLYGDANADSFIAGPEVGVRFFVNDTTFIGASVAYEFLFDDADEADEGFSDGQFVYGLAIGFQF